MASLLGLGMMMSSRLMSGCPAGGNTLETEESSESSSLEMTVK